jgi:hypothetical protein
MRGEFFSMIDLPEGHHGVFAVQPSCEKYSAFLGAKITTITCAVPHSSEGRTRRHGRWVRDAMDAAASRDE